MSAQRCHCACGYSCGGRGACALSPLACLEAAHFVRDCGHDFSVWQETDYGGTMVCSRCAVTAIGHDSMCGP